MGSALLDREKIKKSCDSELNMIVFIGMLPQNNRTIDAGIQSRHPDPPLSR